MDKCDHCRREFQEGDSTQFLPSPERVLLGQKSGVLGFYQHESYQPADAIRVHFPACFIASANPDENPYLYDQLMDEARAQLEDEINEEIKERYRERYDRVRKQIGDGDFNFCVECFDEVEEPNYMCLWCKKTDAVWTQNRATGEVRYCSRCQKFWDEDEQELAA